MLALTPEESCGTGKMAASGSGPKSRPCRKSQVVSSVELLSACGISVDTSGGNIATCAAPNWSDVHSGIPAFETSEADDSSPGHVI